MTFARLSRVEVLHGRIAMTGLIVILMIELLKTQ